MLSSFTHLLSAIPIPIPITLYPRLRLHRTQPTTLNPCLLLHLSSSCYPYVLQNPPRVPVPY
ncbi:hypothetical protein BGY98DRAFT_1048965 [Russula aff. rugulosa BPL654]|nr:hypothetical protein BGY98DRAFT_1048965 [Russula aff. rugulosa BPL654]